MSKKSIKTNLVVGSGNVFEDLGLEDSEELLIRAKLGSAVSIILKEQSLKQFEITKLLEIEQAEVSKLINGKYHLFSESRLLKFLQKLERKVTIYVGLKKKGDPSQEVFLVQ